jgi:Family of unknown function (DUF6299)
MKTALVLVSALLAIVAIAGFLALRLRQDEASAHVSALTINSTGTVSHDGFRVGLTGTLNCTAGEQGFIEVSAFQFVRGQTIVEAHGFASFSCDGVEQTWAVTAHASKGFFKQGQANARVRLTTFRDGFDFKIATANVRLRRGEPSSESPPQSPPFFGAVTSTAGAVGGATVLAIVAAGMTFGFVRVVRRNERRDRDI